MKKHIILAAAIVGSICAIAQPKADSRLIATANFEFRDSAFVPLDSTIFSYKGNNGWDYATQSWKFDTATVWTFNAAASTWIDDSAIRQEIVNDRLINTFYTKRVAGVWQNELTASRTYANGLIATMEHSYYVFGTPTPSNRYSVTYNSNQQITQTQIDTWNYIASAWNEYSRTINHYNSANQLDTATYQNWYSAGSWNNIGRTINTYDHGRLIFSLHQRFSGGIWTDDYREYTTYGKNNLPALVEKEEWDVQTNAWKKTTRREFEYDGTLLAEERYGYWAFNKFYYQYKTSYTYNQAGRILTRERFTWNIAANTWWHSYSDDKLLRNHYEDYTNDVKTVVSNLAELTVFPVPAKDELTIAVSFGQTQPVSITMHDMSGRLVKHITAQAGPQYNTGINVADLPAGNYMLHITGTTEMAAKMISITH